MQYEDSQTQQVDHQHYILLLFLTGHSYTIHLMWQLAIPLIS